MKLEHCSKDLCEANAGLISKQFLLSLIYAHKERPLHQQGGIPGIGTMKVQASCIPEASQCLIPVIFRGADKPKSLLLDVIS